MPHLSHAQKRKLKRQQQKRRLAYVRPKEVPQIQVFPLFTSQREVVAMPPLVRGNTRTENITFPDGRVITSNAVMWMNDEYAVAVYEEVEGVTHITVQRVDGQPARDWRHLQQIKNETCGVEREAVELFPAQSRVVDLANTTHLFVLGEGVQMPLGF